MKNNKYYKDQLEADQIYFHTSCGRNLAITINRDSEAEDIAVDLDSGEKIKISDLYGMDTVHINEMAWNFTFPQANLDD